MVKRTLYDVLQVSRNADPETIKAAYKSLTQRYHPDKNPDNPDAEKHLKEIDRADEVLSDPVKRAGYDAALADDDEEQTVGQMDSSDIPPRAAPAGNDESNKSQHVGPGIEIHPWRRLCARTLDYVLWMFVLSMLHGVGMLLGWAFPAKVNPLVFGLAGIFSWIFVESFLLSTYGTTPGKWLLNIFVTGKNGDKEYLKSCALSRSWKVWVRGMCLGVPLICLVGYILAYIGLKREGTTSWDRDEGLVVTYKPVGGVAWSVAVLIFFTSGFLQSQAIKNYNTQLDRPAATQSQSQAIYKSGDIPPDGAVATLAPDSQNQQDQGVSQQQAEQIDEVVSPEEIARLEAQKQTERIKLMFNAKNYEALSSEYSSGKKFFLSDFYYFGVALYSTEKYAQALSAFLQAESQYPNDPTFKTYLGNSYYTLGDQLNALKKYHEAENLLPNDSVIKSNLGDAYSSIGDPVKALKKYREALALDPKNSRARENIKRITQDKHRSAPYVNEYDTELRKEWKRQYLEAVERQGGFNSEVQLL